MPLECGGRYRQSPDHSEFCGNALALLPVSFITNHQVTLVWLGSGALSQMGHCDDREERPWAIFNWFAIHLHDLPALGDCSGMWCDGWIPETSCCCCWFLVLFVGWLITKFYSIPQGGLEQAPNSPAAAGIVDMDHQAQCAARLISALKIAILGVSTLFWLLP